MSTTKCFRVNPIFTPRARESVNSDLTGSRSTALSIDNVTNMYDSDVAAGLESATFGHVSTSAARYFGMQMRFSTNALHNAIMARVPDSAIIKDISLTIRSTGGGASIVSAMLYSYNGTPTDAFVRLPSPGYTNDPSWYVNNLNSFTLENRSFVLFSGSIAKSEFTESTLTDRLGTSTLLHCSASLSSTITSLSVYDIYFSVTYEEVTPSERPTIHVKMDGLWKDGELKAKVDGEWVDASAIYIKSDGNWIEID